MLRIRFILIWIRFLGKTNLDPTKNGKNTNFFYNFFLPIIQKIIYYYMDIENINSKATKNKYDIIYGNKIMKSM